MSTRLARSPLLVMGWPRDTVVVAVLVILAFLAVGVPVAEAAAGWSDAGSMITARAGHAATLLHNGMVLVAGGSGVSVPISLASAEAYNSALDSWASAGSMATRRFSQTATLLDNGEVLVAGGVDQVFTSREAVASAEMYNPAT